MNRKRLIFLITALLISTVAFGARKKRDTSEDNSGPSKTKMDVYEVKTDSKSMKKRDSAINQLKELIKEYPEGPAKAGVYRRLAELYWEKARGIKAVVMEEYNKKTDKYYELNDPSAPMPELDLKPAWKWNKEAIDVCKYIIKKYDGYTGLDEVYFFMASNLMEVGQSLPAIRYYKLVVEKFKNSKYAADAYFEMGEYWFNNNNVFKAMPNYKAIVDRYKTNKFYGFALYKYGWCLYNVGEYEQSIKTFQATVAFSSKSKKISLKEDALKDMVRPYAEAGNVDDAERYFKNIVKDKKYYIMVLSRLSSIYDEQDRSEDAIKIYRKLLTEEPNDRRAPSWQKQIVEAYKKLNNKDAVREEVLVLVKKYADPEASWVKANQKESSDLESARQTSEFNLKRLLVEYHTEARKTNAKQTWTIVAELYPIYLKYFPKAEDSYNMRFNYAEMLYDTKQYTKAGDQYQIVADTDPKGSHFEDSSYGAVACFGALLAKDQKRAREEAKKRLNASKGKNEIDESKIHVAGKDKKDKKAVVKFEKKKLPELHQKFIKATETYIKNIPHSKYLVDIIYKQAITYYAFNHFDKAVPSFEMIVKKYPRDNLAEYSANLIMDSLNITEDWEAISDKARSFLRNTALISGRPKLKKDLERFKVMATFYAAEVPAKKGKYIESAERYLAFVTEFPKSKYNDVSLYNANSYYVKGGDIYKAIRVQERFLRESDNIYKNSKLRKDIMFQLAKNYAAIAYYDKAAQLYLDFVEKAPDHKNAGDAVHDAAIYLEKLNDTEKAIDNYKLYVEKYAKDDNDKMKLALQYGSIWMRKGKTFYDKAKKGFRNFLDNHTEIKGLKDFYFINEKGEKKEVEGDLEVEIAKGDPNNIYFVYSAFIKMAEEQNNKEEYYENIDKVLQIAKKGKFKEDKALDEVSRDIIAKAMIEELEPEFKEYMTVNFQIKVKKKMRGYDVMWYDDKDLDASERKWKEAAMKEWKRYNTESQEKIETKMKKVAALEKKYTAVIAATKSPRLTPAALYYIGMIYKDLTDQMFNVTLFPGMTEGQIQKFKEKLDTYALNARKKAVEAFETAMIKGYQTSVYNEWVKKSKYQLRFFQEETAGKYYDENEIVPSANAIETSSQIGRIDMDIKFKKISEEERKRLKDRLNNNKATTPKAVPQKKKADEKRTAAK